MQDNFPRAIGAGVAGLVALALACEPNLPAERPLAEAPARVRTPVADVDGDVSRNLLQGYIDRDPDVVEIRRVCPEGQPECEAHQRIALPVTWEDESRRWRMPFQSKRVVAALMIAAAHDRLDNLRFILTPDAQWGWPDPRRPGSRPVFDGDGGEAFFRALRAASQRLPRDAKWVSQPVPPGVQMLLMTGAEPMWTYYAEGTDGILMHQVLYGGKARIDYIGLFEQRPTTRPSADAYGPPPPIKPRLRPPPDATPAAPRRRPAAPQRPPAAPEPEPAG